MAALAAIWGFTAQAQPANKPVRVIVGFAAGGGTDISARFMAEKLRGVYASTVIVENRVGAASRIAVEHVKNSDPDGTTLLFTPDFPMVVYPHSYKKLDYDPVRDFIAAAPISRTNLVVSVGPAVPESVKSVADFVQWARTNPKGAFFATTAAGATPHFTGVMLSRAAGIELTPVHYKGGGPAMQDLVGGQVPMSVNPVSEALPNANARRIRVIATTGAERSNFFPDVPTMVESGYKDVVVIGYTGFYMPAKTPPQIVAKFNGAVSGLLKTEEMRQSLAKLGANAFSATSEEFGQIIRRELERWGPIVKASGFTAED
ncbi:MAG: extra-cytoplasmic solute receptor [Betaproteobacteria bacterium]|nr:extra-cytoplasmic solute receptor [Betaproteobacteria bacterium]